MVKASLPPNSSVVVGILTPCIDSIMMAVVRTTLTLDPDVVRLIEDAVHRERRPTKQVINDALRRALAPRPADRTEPYRLVPHDSLLQPGLDIAGFNRLADDLEDKAIIEKARQVL
jgi:hypothetical protein